jgi:hypothetical protein
VFEFMEWEICMCGHKKEDHYDCKGFCQFGHYTEKYIRLCKCKKYRFSHIGELERERGVEK